LVDFGVQEELEEEGVELRMDFNDVLRVA